MEIKRKLHFVCWDSNSGVSCGIMKVFLHCPNAAGSVEVLSLICIQKGIVSGEYLQCKIISTCLCLCKVLVLAWSVNICTPWLFPVFFSLHNCFNFIKIYDTFSLLTDQTGKLASQREMMCIGAFWSHICISVWELPENPSLKNQQIPFIFSQFILSFRLFGLEVEKNSCEASVAD